MPPELNIRRFKGLRLYYPKSEKAQDELSQADNILFDQEGVIVARPGFRHVMSSNVDASVLGFFDDTHPLVVFNHPTFSTALIFVKKNKRIWFTDGVTPFTELVGGSDSTSYEAAVYDQKIYTAGGIYYNLTTMAPVSGSPGGREMILVHKDRIWLATRNTTLTGSDPYRLYFSEPGAPVGGGGWPAANFIDIKTNTPNRAFASYRDNIYIFKTDSMWVLNTGGLPANWNLRQIGSVGCLGGCTVYGNVLYWISELGFFSYNGVEVRRLSDPIQSYFDSNAFVYDSYSQVVGFKGNLYICIQPVGGNRELWVYNVARGLWSKIVHGMGTQFGRMLPIESKFGVSTDTIPVGLYFGGSGAAALVNRPHLWRTDGAVFKDESYLDVDIPYTVTIETEQFDFEEPLRKKRMTRASIEAQFTDLTIDQYDEESRTKQKVFVGKDPTKVTQVEFPAIGYFRRMRFKISSANFPSGLKLFGLRATLKAEGRESAESAGTYANQP